MDAPPPRIVTLLLCTRDGRVLGMLPPFEVTFPWWQDSLAVVQAARQRYAVEVTILRVVDTGAGSGPPGGPVTYLAEIEEQPFALRPWSGADPLAPEPHRLPYARPGGPAADVGWADAALTRLGRQRAGEAVQMRSWNLSSIWRLPTDGGPVWLKVVPSFFAHEGATLAALADSDGDIVPALLAHDGCRILMDDIPGDDRYDAALPELLAMVTLLVRVQRRWPQRLGDLEALGLPDWRHPVLTDRIADTLIRTCSELDSATCSAVESLLAGMAQRYCDIDSCGIPDTLVHGDFHPGNVRGRPSRFVLLDWGDSGIGNPLLDQAAFLERVPETALDDVRRHWSREWRAAVPGSDPDRAAALTQPLAALRQAVTYRAFLDGIEPDEHVYHRDDPALWLRRAAALAALTG